MTRCPRPGCTGEVVGGNCRACGIAVAAPADQEAAELRRLAEEQASRLRDAAANKASGTGWFRAPEDGGAARQSGAHRKPDLSGSSSSVAAPPGHPAGDAPEEPSWQFGAADGRPAADDQPAEDPAADPEPWHRTPLSARHPANKPDQPRPGERDSGQSQVGADSPPWHRTPSSAQHANEPQPDAPQPDHAQPSRQADHLQLGEPQPNHQQAGVPQPEARQASLSLPNAAQANQPQSEQWQATQALRGQAQSSQPPVSRPQADQVQQNHPQPSRPLSGQPQSEQRQANQPQLEQWQANQALPSHPDVSQPQPRQPASQQQWNQPPASQPPSSQPQASQPSIGQSRANQPPSSQRSVSQPQTHQSQAGQPQGNQSPGNQSQAGQWQGSQPRANQWTGQQVPPGQWGQPPPGYPVHSGQPQPGMAWQQNIPMPDVLPRQPGERPPAALSEDDPSPTSVLGDAPVTLSIEPPPPAEEEEAKPATAPESPHSTGSSSFPGTGRRTASRVSGRGRLGAGLVEVPVVPVKNPASAVLTDPAVSESKRFCSNCGAEVGRGGDDTPGATEGECATCGTSFNFRPRLFRGDLVGGQYEVLGCLAYGGLGWIYLAKDHNVSDRWVVLKGMIDTGDATSMASAVAERRFLAEVEHPNVVRIYNFVQHPDPKTGNLAGYIVMEYVGGQSLRQLALEHHREAGRAVPLPIGQVIAYGLEILPAIGYLHSIDMLYCDLKPDNVIQSGEQLKLIDLGAVRQTDDYESPLFFTLGYSAPELPTEGASIASDIYTVGRTLAVLSIEFAGYTTRHKYTVPGPDEEPLFALFGSYYRILKRATHQDPVLRFTSAEEMADQLTGVLREVMALGTGRPRPGQSSVFAIETRTFGSGMVVGEHGSLPSPDPLEVAAILALPMVDSDDHAASTLASITATEPAEMVAALASAPQDSIEVRLRMVRARLELNDLRAAAAELEAARRLVTDPADWRPDWYQGLIAIATRRPADATAAFEKVYDAVPGEIPPKLALAITAEYAGNYFAAARYYELVWHTDRSWVSAAFGLARVYLAQGGRVSAIEVLEAVPDTSSHHVAAQVAAIKIKTRKDATVAVGEHDLHDAARRLERLSLDAERRTTLASEVLEAAYGWVCAGRPGAADGSDARMVLGCQLSERELRFGLERCYRALARLAGTSEQRHELVDKANAIRPRTVT